jgi:hypothetical protein
MPPPRIVLALGTLLVVLSGCAGPDAGPLPGNPSGTSPTGSEEASGADAATDPGAAPEWRLGDWWTYKVEFVASELTFDMTIVVYGQDGSSWLLSSNDRAANIQAEFSHFPTLGRWTQTDLQPTIHGAPIPFFRWPLSDGKSWDDPYRGIPATWNAKAAQVATPNGTTDGFDLALEVQDGQYANYTYARSVGWFTKLEQGFGSPAVRMKLTAYGRDFKGQVSVLTYVEHLHGPLPVLAADPGTTPPQTEPQRVFEVGSGGTLAWGFYYGGAPGAYGFTFHPAGGDATAGASTSGQPVDGTVHFEYGEVTNPPAGQWVSMGGGASHGFGFAFGEILEVHDAK